MPGGKEKIFVYGASGHAKVVIDVIERQGQFDIAFIIDDDKRLKGKVFCGYSVIGGREELCLAKNPPHNCIVAIGSNETRHSISQWLAEQQYELVTAIHPAAQIGRDVSIGPGSVIMANAVVNAAAKIGKGVIINTGTTVEHDCVIEDGVHLAPGSVVCGSVRVGNLSFIGAGSIIINNTVIGDNVMVGAGTTVYKDVPNKSRVIGVR